MAEGLASLSSEMANRGDAIIEPDRNLQSQAITIPDDAMPVKLPPVTSPPLTSMPMFQDQNFTQADLIVLPTTTIQSLSPAYEIFTTGNQVLSLEQSHLLARALIKRWPGFTGSDLPFNFDGTNGTQYIFPNGGFWSLVQNLTVQINGVPLPNFQAGNVLAQLWTHPNDVPMTYCGDTAYAFNTQIKTMQNDMGVSQFFNRHAQGSVKPYEDFTGFTNVQANSTTGQYVYFRIPLKHLWAFYQTPGRLWTNAASLRLNFVLSGLTIQATQVLTMPSAYAGLNPALGDYVIAPDTQSISQPVEFTITDLFIEIPQFNAKTFFNQQVLALNAERPLSMTMQNVEIFNDPNWQNIDLTKQANWGNGTSKRQLLKSSGYLPHHWFCVPTVTCEWQAQGGGGGTPIGDPFGITGLIWRRSAIIPGMFWPRRVYLGGQAYFDDMAAVQWGDTNVASALNGFMFNVEKRARRLQQQGNYLDAPDQRWLNNYANSTQLAPAAATSGFFALTYLNESVQTSLAGAKVLLWAQGIGAVGMSLSQDPSFDTLADSRSQSFEVETALMPYWGAIFEEPNQNPAVMFMGIDRVWSKQSITVGAGSATVTVPMIPAVVKLSLQHALPFAMDVNYGPGRTCQYDFLQPSMGTTTNVPM